MPFKLPRVCMSRRRLSGLLLPVIFLLVGSAFLQAQLSSTATISGTVTDASGAVVPNASVTATDESTHVATTSKTNNSGGFVFPGLPVGTYSLAVTSNGFSAYRESGVVLHPAMTQNLTIKLQPASVKSEVVVNATAAQVETATPEISGEVSSQQVSTLPLNGRNYASLAAVMPGVQNMSAGSSLGEGGRSTRNVVSVNGGGTNSTFYALDGIWDENTGNMDQTSIVPNPDSLEEVRVLQNDYSVRYSLMGASVVLLQTRSGGSEFHGNAWEYLRNTDLNARNYFSTSIPQLNQNIFGYDIGGPLFIPHHYNADRRKTFFFWDQQWVKLHQGLSLTGVTPTADQRAGLISSSAPIMNPATGSPFPQNSAGQYVISPINPNSAAYIKAVYPLPNYSKGSLNYINNTPQITNQRDDEIKIDHHFTPRLSLMGEYLDERQNYKQSSLNGATSGEVFSTNWEDDVTANQLAQLSLTQLFSSNIVNSTSISMNIYDLDLNVAGIDYVNQVPGFNESLPFNGILANRIPSVSFSGGISPEGIANSRPLHHAADLDDSINDNFSWLHGKNYIQAGLNIVFNTKRQNINTSGAAGTNGGWTFTGTTTGNALADFLLGYAETFSQASNERRMQVHAMEFSPYIEDQISVTRRLKVTVGMRFFHMPLPHSPQTETIFEPSAYKATAAPVIDPLGHIISSGYNPLNGLVANGQNGVPLNFSNRHNWYFGPSGGFAWDVFGNGTTSVRGGFGLAHTRVFTGQDCSFNCGNNPPAIASVALQNVRWPDASTGTATNPSIQNLQSADPDVEASQIESYSLSVEHQFGHNWIASVAAAGSLTHHLVGTANYNQPLPDGQYDFNPLINNGSKYSPYYFSPYIGWASISTIETRQNSNWSALEASLRHPVTKSFFLSFAYTWSHDLTNSLIDVYHPSRYYGNAPGTNIPQSASVTAIWNLPKFQKGKLYERAVLGGWRYSDITTFRSGISLDPGLSIKNQGFASRPDMTGAKVPGPKTVKQWFNTAAYRAPAPGYIGDASLGSVQGPGLIDFDMALYKDFHFLERNTIEFRGEAFNVFNHTNFSGVSTKYGSSTFGQVTGALDPRIFELALRYEF